LPNAGVDLEMVAADGDASPDISHSMNANA
jgi:hypothetical protein